LNHESARLTCAFLACGLLLAFAAKGRAEEREVPLVTNKLEQYGNGPLLAVSRTDGNKVTLVGLDGTSREIGTIPLACKGPFGIAFSQKQHWLYTTCWDHSKIALIDLRHQGEPQLFAAPRLPAWIRLRESADEIWISNEGAGTVTVYQAGSSTALAEIATGAGPSDIVFTHNGRRAWISNETAGTVSLVDAVRRKKILDIPVGKVPQGMAVAVRQKRLLVTNFSSDSLSVIDSAKPRHLSQIPVCEGPVAVAVARLGKSELAYVSCFKGNAIAIVDLERGQEIQRIAVGDKPFGISAQPGSNWVYVCVGGANQLVTIQAGRPSRITGRMALDGNPLLNVFAAGRGSGHAGAR
jgi:YVTN family beta-propeller protein